MRHVVHDKYFLKDLLREIDLYDRKLEHLRHHGPFESESERDRAVRATTTRRDNLAITARKLITEGIGYDEAALPMSMLTPQQISRRQQKQQEVPAPVAETRSEVHVMPSSAPLAEESQEKTPFGEAIERLQQQAKTAGMPQVSWKDELLDYKRKRNKIPA